MHLLLVAHGSRDTPNPIIFSSLFQKNRMKTLMNMVVQKSSKGVTSKVYDICVEKN